MKRVVKFVIIMCLFIIFLILALSFAFFFFGERRTGGRTVPRIDSALEGTPEGEKQKENLEKFEAEGKFWAENTPKEEWIIKSFDNHTLRAELYKNSDSHLYVVFAHGFHDSAARYYNYVYRIYNMGYNILMITQRAHKPSGGNFITMGLYESRDLKDWADKLVCFDKDARIAIFGVSMGATASMMAAGMKTGEQVKCIIEDSGYSSVPELYKYILKHDYHLPEYPFVPLIAFWSKCFGGWNIYKADTAAALPNAAVPMLFLHGTKDKKVPIEQFEKIISSYRGLEYKKVVFEGAGHLKAYLSYPEKFYSEIEEFLKKYM